jgi:hypothetical protein
VDKPRTHRRHGGKQRVVELAAPHAAAEVGARHWQSLRRGGYLAGHGAPGRPVGALLPLLVALRWAPLARFEAGAEVPEPAFNLLRGLTVFAPLPLASLEDLAGRVAAVPARS